MASNYVERFMCGKTYEESYWYFIFGIISKARHDFIPINSVTIFFVLIECLSFTKLNRSMIIFDVFCRF
jgi:hypothetical protein